MSQADLFQVDYEAARLRVRAVADAAANRAIEEVRKLAESARRSMGQRHRWSLWRLGHV